MSLANCKTAQPRFKDLTGQRFDRLTAISWFRKRSGKTSVVFWNCKCDCGIIKSIRSCHILSGRIKSCTCLQRVRARENGKANKRHGMKWSKEWNAWQGLKGRCKYEKMRGFQNYGGRGIRVCDRWLHSFEAFFNDVGQAPGIEYSIERIDVNGHYEPGNVKWATDMEQANNKRTNRILTAFGESKTVSQWAVDRGMKRVTLFNRLWLGWSIEEALTTPVQKRRYD